VGATLRLAVPDDAEGIAGIYGPIVESTLISFEADPPSLDEIRSRIQHTLPAHPWLVCDRDGEVAGYAYATQHRVRTGYRWSVDTSVYVHPDDRRRGIGRALYTSLIRVLIAQGYFNAFAGIALPNAGSVGLHESVGFRPLGVYRNVGYKLGGWCDVGWWQLALQPVVDPPQPPLSVTDLQNAPAWPDMLAAGASFIREG